NLRSIPGAYYHRNPSFHYLLRSILISKDFHGHFLDASLPLEIRHQMSCIQPTLTSLELYHYLHYRKCMVLSRACHITSSNHAYQNGSSQQRHPSACLPCVYVFHVGQYHLSNDTHLQNNHPAILKQAL